GAVAIRACSSARRSWTTRTARRTIGRSGRADLRQSLALLGSEDLFELLADLLLQGFDLILLFIGQIQLVADVRRHQGRQACFRPSGRMRRPAGAVAPRRAVRAFEVVAPPTAPLIRAIATRAPLARTAIVKVLGAAVARTTIEIAGTAFARTAVEVA